MNFYFKPSIAIAMLGLYLTSCNEGTFKSKEIVVNPDTELPQGFWDDIISDDIEYFTLSGQKSNKLSTITYILRVGDYIVSTHPNTSTIYFHDLNGSFQHHLRSSGKGPLEFSEVMTIARFDDHHILINDPSKNSILKYNISNQKITEEFKTNLYIYNMYYDEISTRLIFTTNDFDSGFIKYVDNMDFKNIYPLIHATAPANMIVSRAPFLKINGQQLIINIGFLDTIYLYNFQTNKMDKKYILGKGETNISKTGKEKIINAVMERKLKIFEKVIAPMGEPSMIDKYLIIPLFYHGEYKSLVIDTQNEHSYFYNFHSNKGNKIDFIDQGGYSIRPFTKDNEGYFYDIGDLPLTKINHNFSSELPFVRNFNKLLAENDENPFIIRFKLK
ncbi:MAG: 6-bladed beta-propeller [Saprospiraceae bacterium]|nr:6-bladed beta-propeller [Saprospiraceae bacterium]